jgi:hypothetical protein
MWQNGGQKEKIFFLERLAPKYLVIFLLDVWVQVEVKILDALNTRTGFTVSVFMFQVCPVSRM